MKSFELKTLTVQPSLAQATIVGVSVGVVLWRLYFQSASYTPVVVVYLSICVVNIPYSGYLGGVKFSWMLGFVVIRGIKFVVRSGSNHTPRARVQLWPLISK